MQEQIQKRFFVSVIIAFELAVLNFWIKKRTLVIGSQYVKQTFLGLCISLREIFFNWIASTVINKYGKGGAAEFWKVLGPP